MSSRPHTQRATTWLSLVVAVLVALVPAGGMAVCLGHDGHLGFGVGVASAGASDGGTQCPCQHDSTHSTTVPSTPSAVVDAEHPPCDDLLLDSSEVVRESSSSSPLAKAAADLGGDDLPPPTLQGWVPDFLWPDSDSVQRASWSDAARRRPRQQLELHRSVVLLI